MMPGVMQQGGAILQKAHATIVFGNNATFVGNTCGKVNASPFEVAVGIAFISGSLSF